MEFADELCQHDEPQVMPEIEAMRESFRRAYCGTSFSPEKRADSCVNDFSKELSSDLELLGDRAGDYKEKYLSWLRSWAGKMSRVMSVMITGPSKFPTESNAKRIKTEMKCFEDFRAWRTKRLRVATSEPTLAPEDEIKQAESDLAKQRKIHEVMIDINKIVRSKISDEGKRGAIARKYGYSAKTISNIMEPEFGRPGFDTFQLTNSNAKIKRLEEKIETLKSRVAHKETFEAIAFPGGSIDIENDRVVIYHDAKPVPDVISRLKSKGFHWSPRFKCWCRKHTAQALFDAKKICGAQ